MIQTTYPDLTQNSLEEVGVSSSLLEKRRECPSCGYKTLFGIPGGRDAVCENCGYKDPCCSD